MSRRAESTAEVFLRRRRAAVAAHPTQIGLEWVEVEAGADPATGAFDLVLHFIPDDSGAGAGKHRVLDGLAAADLRFAAGGEVVDGLFSILAVDHPDPDAAEVTLTLLFAGTADAARRLAGAPVFTVELVDLPQLDPYFARAGFSLSTEVPLALDCEEECPPPEESEELAGDYLARDWASFRQLMLDQLAQRLPTWKERGAAEQWVALVEVLAHAADELSYFQDAVATESYLGTARRRISVRRHARLVDYLLHEGANARAWVYLTAAADGAAVAAGTQLLTRVSGLPVVLAPGSPELARALGTAGVEVFETAHDATLWLAHNEIPLYTWEAEEFALPAGATAATLEARLPRLEPGDVLVFEEVLGAETGLAEDADPAHRHAVRLTTVRGAEDLLATTLGPAAAGTGTLASTGTAVTGSGTTFTTELRAGDVITAVIPAGPQTWRRTRRVTAIASDTELTVDEPFEGDLAAGTAFELGRLTEVCWHEDDALPFDLCAAALAADGTPVAGAAVARGNVVLADHGRTVGGAAETLVATAGRFRPRLERRGLTHRQPFDPAAAAALPAAVVQTQDPAAALPALTLSDVDGAWNLRRDLLASDRFARDFVVEMEDDGTAVLRFGDGELGRPPAPGTALVPVYRVGHGAAGNLGHDSLHHLVSGPGVASAARNPLAARGGVDPQGLDEVRRAAPGVLRARAACTTEGDFVKVAESFPGVERAAASLRWTGSWHVLQIAVQREGGEALDPAFEAEFRRYLEDYRLAGWELAVTPLEFVGLDIAFTAVLRPDASRGAVDQALKETFSNLDLPGGGKGFFHPDNFSFGQSVYLSRMVDTALGLAGVRAVDTSRDSRGLHRFRRFGQPPRGELEAGQIRLSGREIARVDNDPEAPENGRVQFFLEGGR